SSDLDFLARLQFNSSSVWKRYCCRHHSANAVIHPRKRFAECDILALNKLDLFCVGVPLAHICKHGIQTILGHLQNVGYLADLVALMFCHSSFLLSCRLDPINGFCPSSSSHSNILPHPAHWRRFILRRATSGLPQRGHGLPRGSSMALLDHHVDCLAQLGPVTVVNPQIATAGLGIHSADNDKLASAFIIDPDRVGSLIEKRLPFRNY